jgi:hypothetical protein
VVKVRREDEGDWSAPAALTVGQSSAPVSAPGVRPLSLFPHLPLNFGTNLFNLLNGFVDEIPLSLDQLLLFYLYSQAPILSFFVRTVLLGVAVTLIALHLYY